MPSSSVDLPVPFSPAMMVIGAVETQFEIVAQERQAERIGRAVGDRAMDRARSVADTAPAN